MSSLNIITSEIQLELNTIYAQIMWLANQKNVTASEARAWYTHIKSEKLKRKVRLFSGKISTSAANPKSTNLQLEHYKRIQTELTKLVERHKVQKISDPNEFIKLIIACEYVHIVTVKENYAAMKSKGNYKKANIELVPWNSISRGRRVILWKKMLSGKVANAEEYKIKE